MDKNCEITDIHFLIKKIGKYRLNAIWSYIYDDIDYSRLIYELKLR